MCICTYLPGQLDNEVVSYIIDICYCALKSRLYKINTLHSVVLHIRYRPDATSHSRLTRECVMPAWNNCEWSLRVKCAREWSSRVSFTRECSSRVVLAGVFHSRVFTGLHLCSSLELETINR